MQRWLALLAVIALSAGAWWFATTPETRLVARDAATGRVVWSTAIAGADLLAGEPISAAGRLTVVVVPRADGGRAAGPPRLIQLDAASGARLADVPLPAEEYGLDHVAQAISVRPVVTAETVYIKLFARDESGSNSPALLALDPTTGAVRWSHTGLIDMDLTFQPPDFVAVAGLVVTLAAEGDMGVVRALDARTGETRWQVPVESLQSMAGQYYSAPVIVADETTVFVSGGERLLALDAQTGELRFEHRANGGMLAVADGAVYRRESYNVLVALDADSGAERWRYQSPTVPEGDSRLFGVAARAGRVVVGWECSTERYPTETCLIGLDAGSGAEHWRSGVLSQDWYWDLVPLLAGDTVLLPGTLVTGENQLTALAAADGVLRWATPLPGIFSRQITTTESEIVSVSVAPRWRHWAALLP